MIKEVKEMRHAADRRRLPLTRRAVDFAEHCHEGQKRVSGANYIVHPVSVCRILLHLGISDDDILASAILHDVMEDKDVGGGELHKMFGDTVTNLVELNTRRKGESFEESCRRTSQDIRAVMSKAADRTHNLSDVIRVFSHERLRRYITETESCILPMIRKAVASGTRYEKPLRAMQQYIEMQVKEAKDYLQSLSDLA